MKLVEKNERGKVAQYLKHDIPNSIYMLIDILNLKNGENQNITFWYEPDGDNINTVVMKYYDSIQLFSIYDDCDLSGAAKIINSHPVGMVSGKASIIKRIAPLCVQYGGVEYGSVFRADRCRETVPENVCLADIGDVPDIVALLCSNQTLGAHYSPPVLEDQMIARMTSHTGRSYIIRQHGQLVAHTATYAETDGLAVVSGTIIRPGFGHLHYYTISNYMIRQLLREEKQIYMFAISDQLVKHHNKVHTKCAEYGKMVLPKKITTGRKTG